MSKESVKRNSEKSKNLSLFKIGFLFFLFLLTENLYIRIALLTYCFLFNLKEFLLFLVLAILIYFLNQYRFDFMKYGIVDYRLNDHYQIDKIFYKTYLYTDEELNNGDILHLVEESERINNDSLLSRNILYYEKGYQRITSFPLRKIIDRRINTADSELIPVYQKLFYNITSYEELSFDLGYGLISYYLFYFLYRKAKKAGLWMMIIYILLFSFELKFLLLICLIISDKLKMDESSAFGFRIIVISLINEKLLFNNSLLITILLNLYRIVELPVSFRTLLFMIESHFFGEIDLLTSFFFEKLLKLRCLVFVLALICLFISPLEPLLLLVVKMLDKLNSYSLSVRGSLSFISLILFILIYRRFRNEIMHQLLIIGLLLSPLNDPFIHVSFIDVGQGDAILIRNPLSFRNVLIDTGSSYNYHKLRKQLFKEGVYIIDKLIISHGDADHNGNIENLKKDFKLIKTIEEGESFSEGGLNFIYYDCGQSDNDNDNSLIYSLNIDSYTFLFTGDISSEIERKLIGEYGLDHIDFLKVAHHGSKTASDEQFISVILPEFAFISTSGQYGHPHQEVIDTLEKYKIDYFITARDKTISVYLTAFWDFIRTGNNDFVIIKS